MGTARFMLDKTCSSQLPEAARELTSRNGPAIRNQRPAKAKLASRRVRIGNYFPIRNRVWTRGPHALCLRKLSGETT